MYHFPSRTECTMCHTVTAKYALGVNTRQMNKDHDYGGVVANQLATLNHLGLFTQAAAGEAGQPAESGRLPRQEPEAGRAGAVVSARQLQPLPPQVGRRHQ